MRHRKKGKSLGRKVGPRRALMKSLATSLVLKGKIKTTEAKAKALRPIIEKHITSAGKNTLAVRRKLLGYFYDEKAVKKLMDKIGPMYKARKGGYTRIIKIGARQGDGAKMAIIEFVDYKKKTESSSAKASVSAKATTDRSDDKEKKSDKKVENKEAKKKSAKGGK